MTMGWSANDQAQLARTAQQVDDEPAPPGFKPGYLLDRAHCFPVERQDDVTTPQTACGCGTTAGHAGDPPPVDLAVSRMIRRDLAQRGAGELRRPAARFVPGIAR